MSAPRDAADPRDIIDAHLDDAQSGFSIGALGAIAEFLTSDDEPLTTLDRGAATVGTAHGAMRVDIDYDTHTLAYETLSRRSSCWRQGVVFCIPEARNQIVRRTELTELGPDREAIHGHDREAILFDMGLGTTNLSFCIRTGDPVLLARLRASVGTPLLVPGSATMNEIIDHSPHRIAISALGRIEVYQRIDRVKTPDGPHTHLLPTLLASKRTHEATIPVPPGYLPALSLHPASPVFDLHGNERPFDRDLYESFEALLNAWGVPEFVDAKARIRDAIANDDDPGAFDPPRSRVGRTAMRVAIRQLRRLGGDVATLDRWAAKFDRPAR